jgi:CRP-like cAMP-binding protein
MLTPVSRNGLDRVEALRVTDLFGSLPEPVLCMIASCAITRRLSRGETLYSEHEEASALYVVASGALRSIRQNVEGRVQVLSTERRGAILAAVEIFSGVKFYSTLIADTPAAVLSINKRDSHELCHKHSEILWNLARVLANNILHSADVIETLALRNVDQRVAQHLLTVCHQRGIQDNGNCIVELTMNRSEIASRLGSAREVVSRAFTQLEKTGLIQMQGRRLVSIRNMQALRTFAGAETPPRQTDAYLIDDIV